MIKEKDKESFIVKKKRSLAHPNFQSVCIKRDIIVQLKRKYPDINIKATTEKLLEELLE